jgi:hypothetical protein
MLKLKEVDSLYSNKQKSKLGSVYTVGKEPNNVYLIARDDYEANKTCIEVKVKNERKTLFMDDHHIKCVSASVNNNHTILAYTSVRINSDNKFFNFF